MTQLINNTMNCTGEYVVVPGTLDAFFTIVGVIVSGLFAGFVAVGTLVYKSPETEPEVPYEQKYYEEFHELEERELSKEDVDKLGKTFLCETTPKGDVIICYNGENECFDVWHDDRNIPFKTLDAVAQHYAIVHNLKSLCVDYKEEYDSAVTKVKDSKNKNEAQESNDGTVEEKKADDVFATFKTYNKASEKGKSSDNRIVTERCNRFRRVGGTKDWHEVHDKDTDPVVNADDAKKALSYEEFKAMSQKNKAGESDVGDEEGKKEK